MNGISFIQHLEVTGPAELLAALGFQLHELKEDTDLWRFPKHWKDLIPEGTMVTNIHGNSFRYRKSTHQYLASEGTFWFGVLRHKKSRPAATRRLKVSSINPLNTLTE